MYTALERLEARGLVESAIAEPTPERGGRRKKHDRLTPTGARALRRSYDNLQCMAQDQMAAVERLSEGRR